jgi:uncharacterized protein with PIN domain
MAEATLRFYEELNNYLPPARRRRDIRLRFDPPCPVRHLIEGLHVPHTEIELILIDGVSVPLDAPVHDGDRIAVYPVFEALDVSPLVRLRPAPLRDPRFFADAQLGRLARYLRLLGFDTLYENAVDDAELVRRAAESGRIILSRDRDLLMRRAVTHGIHIREDAPRQQLARVMARCDLAGQARPFTRCLECNGPIEPVRRADVLDQLEPATRAYYDAFWRCAGCGRIYWKGTHYRRLEALVRDVLGMGYEPPNGTA